MSSVTLGKLYHLFCQIRLNYIMIVRDLAQAWHTIYTSKGPGLEAQQRQKQRGEKTNCLWLNVSRAGNNCVSLKIWSFRKLRR